MEIKRTQLDVLEALRDLEDRDDTGSQQIRHLTQTLGVDEETAQAAVDKLVRAGYISHPRRSAEAPPEGGRPAAVYQLTQRGREALAEGPES